MSGTPRILMAITVYDGEDFIRRTLESAKRVDATGVDLDVLVLDDASPARGFSERLEQLCVELGVHYYGSPRNLGIPRNFSLGLLTAADQGYDYVIIANSDVIFPRNLVRQMMVVAQQPGIASVTAWGNNVSSLSLTVHDGDDNVSDQAVVDEISDSLTRHYGDAEMSVPTAVGFCFMIPTSVIETVGIMDPVFGRGYCEEVDWSLRAVAAGLRNVIAPSVFVYHAGQGSNVTAGVLAAGNTTVKANEAIIDMRYPLYRSQVRGFLASDILKEARKFGTVAVLRDAGAQHGYAINVGWMPPVGTDKDIVQCTIAPDGVTSDVRIEWRGFVHQMDFDPFAAHEALASFFHGAEATRVNLAERGAVATALAAEFGDRAGRTSNYPTRV